MTTVSTSAAIAVGAVAEASASNGSTSALFAATAAAISSAVELAKSITGPRLYAVCAATTASQNAAVPASTGGWVVDVVGGWVLVGGCVVVGAWVLVGGCEPMVVVGTVEVPDATVTFGGWLAASATVVSDAAASSAALAAAVVSVVVGGVGGGSRHRWGVVGVRRVSRLGGIRTVVVVAVVAASRNRGSRARRPWSTSPAASTSVDVYD